MSDYFILSLKWTRKKNRELGLDRDEPYVTFWRKDNAGYAWAVCEFGRYTGVQVGAELDYYDDGVNTLAIPCDVVLSMAVEGSDKLMDKRADMRVIPHTKKVMEALKAASLRTSRLQEAA